MKIVLKGKENVYEQIVNEYKRYISLNILKYDDKLPSCRQLAMELGINPNTVVRAYNVLENEGYIRVVPKKGVYVSYDCNSNHLLDTTKQEISDFFSRMKEEKVDYNMIKSLLDKVYGGDIDDSNN